MNKKFFTAALACVLTMGCFAVSAKTYDPQAKVAFSEGSLSVKGPDKGSEALKIFMVNPTDKDEKAVSLSTFLKSIPTIKNENGPDLNFGYMLKGSDNSSKFVSLSTLLGDLEAAKDENAKILRQKKQFKNVIILIIAIIGCGIGIYFLNDNLNHTQNQLTEANKDIASKKSQLEVANRDIASKDSTISVQNSTISSQSNTIANLNDTVSKYNELLEEESSRRISAEDKYETYKSTLSGFQPFIVKSTSFDFSTGKYKINYYGLSYGKYTFSFRVIFPDNSTKNYERSFWVYTGSDNVTVSLSNSFDSGKYYTIEIMYNNRVIGGSRH